MKPISLESFPQSTPDLKFVFILSRGRTLLIFGHLLKQDGRHQTFKDVWWVNYFYFTTFLIPCVLRTLTIQLVLSYGPLKTFYNP